MATEKRLIDAYALYRKFVNDTHTIPIREQRYVATWRISDLIADAPTVDAVEVVRCKDCACYEEICHGYGYCYHWDYEQGMSPNQVEPDNFCSYGERREDGGC